MKESETDSRALSPSSTADDRLSCYMEGGRAILKLDHGRWPWCQHEWLWVLDGYTNFLAHVSQAVTSGVSLGRRSIPDRGGWR